MQAPEKKNKGFTVLELLVVIVLVAVLSAGAYPRYTKWLKDREVRKEAIKIKNLFQNINSQVQRGYYAFVQVHIQRKGEAISFTTNGMKVDTFTEKVRDGKSSWLDFDERCNPDNDEVNDFDDKGSDGLNIEVNEIKTDGIFINFPPNKNGAVCFSKDGSWYSAHGELLSGTEADFESDNVIFICSQESGTNRCIIGETSGIPSDIHDNVFAITWSRFGNIDLEKWNKNDTEDEEGDWVLQ